MNAINKRGYQDVPMTRRRAQLLAEYANKLAEMLENAPNNQDLAEWVQSKIDRAADQIQSAYHYLDQEDDDDLEKAVGHKYTHRKRVGTDKRGRARYRYYYAEHQGGGITSAAFEAGSAFKLTWKGRRGHFHIKSVEGDQVFITHDSRPSMTPVAISKGELRALLKSQHGKAEQEHVEKRRKEVEKIKSKGVKRGLGLALHRLRQAATQAGVQLDERYQRKPKKKLAQVTDTPREDRFEKFNSAQRTALSQIVNELEELQRSKSYNKSREIGPMSVQSRIEEYISASFLREQGFSEEDQKSLKSLVSYFPVSNKVFNLIKERASEIELAPETMRSQLENFVAATITDTLKILSREADDRQSKKVRLALKRFETPQTKEEQAQYFFDLLGLTGFTGRRLSVDGNTARVDIRGKDNKIGFVEFTEQGANFASMPELNETQKEAFLEARASMDQSLGTDTPREDRFETMPEPTPRNELTETAQQIIEEANQDHDERHAEHQEITKFELGEHTHTKTGAKLFTAKQTERTDRDEYFRRVEIAKKHGGRYESRYVKGFVFKNAEDARAFALEIEGAAQEAPETSAETVTPHEDHPSADNFETMPEVESASTSTPKRLLDDIRSEITVERFIREGRRREDTAEREVKKILKDLDALEQGLLNREYSTEAKQAKAQEILNRRLPKILEQMRRLVRAELVIPQLSGGTGQRNAARYHRAAGDIGIAEDRANKEYQRALKELDRLEERQPQAAPREQLTETAREQLTETVRELSDQPARTAALRSTPRASEATLTGSGELSRADRANLIDRARFITSGSEEATKTGRRSSGQKAKDQELLLIYNRLHSDASARLGPLAPRFADYSQFVKLSGIELPERAQTRADFRTGIMGSIEELRNATTAQKSANHMINYRAQLLQTIERIA